MSIATALLNAQRRPEAEAQRLTAAIVEGLNSTSEEGVPTADSYTAAFDAIEETNADIAAEKAPVRVPPTAAESERFADEVEAGPIGYDDDGGEPLESATHRVSSRFMLDDPEPEANDMPDPEPAGPHTENPAAEDGPADAGLPFKDDRTLLSEGMGVVGAAPAEEAPTEEPIPEPVYGTDPETGLPSFLRDPDPEPEQGSEPAHEAPAFVADPDLAPLNDSAEEPGVENALGDDELAAIADAAAAEAIAGYGDPEEPPVTVEGGSQGAPAESSDADGAAADADQASVLPAPASPYSWDRPVSPWDDAEELVPTEMAQEAVDEPATATGAAAPVEPEPVPASTATEPPKEMPSPQPQPEPSIVERAREALSPSRLREKVTAPGRGFKYIGVGVGALLLAIVVVLSFMGGGRGKPPEAADKVSPPPAAIDNTEENKADQTLVPATVSASCGNDSDAVAPFVEDKTRAWVCKRINGLDLNVLNITFDKPVVITSITIVPGFNYTAPDGRDEWSRHRLVTSVSWRMGGKVYPQNIAPTRTGVTEKFPSVITQEMSMTITASTRPQIGKDSTSGSIGGQGKGTDPKVIDETTAVSKIVITGHPVDPGASGGSTGAPSHGK
ncbi:hypothetical protein ACT17_15400 [Mycolicibacterium conceptionense]|uniref:F5/8 type C domain-containing protein n=1 Tax=Mycolicibacterium conceptionense TaxID=451644 RepID=A0A0J8UBC6_9MYCO|nr:hypothetical protein [Mycolicibacterium conceptionense]KMV17655.1 hypothetical protein ACT17_15400 [Mycolicibacterium conceptionense]